MDKKKASLSGPALTDCQLDEFRQNGFLLIKSFYDLEFEVEPIQRGIHHLIGLVLRKYGLPFTQPPFTPGDFDACLQDILCHDRRIGGEIYDAVKQIPAFIRLVATQKNETLVAQVRDSLLPGIAAGGYGIRIDHPQEEQFRAPWHQDYPAQLRSIDGVVLWSPLRPITPELGPVRFCVGSHKDGLARLHTRDPQYPEKTGAYALTLENEAERIARYPHAAPLSEPGDLILIDYLTLHASGYNRANRSRWSMQIRYFNFDHPTALQLGWRGSFAAGVHLTDVHPELIAD